MKLASTNTDAFSIVVAGAWNPAIFSPEWAKDQLAENKALDVVLAVPLSIAPLPPRLTLEGINLFPSQNSLMLTCVEYSDASIKRCSTTLQQIAALLPHTPVNAIGINFRFDGEIDESEKLANLFTFDDASKINSAEYSLVGAVIKRAFKLQDASILNLSLDTLSGGVRLEFNFHSDIQKMADVSAKVELDKIIESRQRAVDFLQNVYNIELDN